MDKQQALVIHCLTLLLGIPNHELDHKYFKGNIMLIQYTVTSQHNYFVKRVLNTNRVTSIVDIVYVVLRRNVNDLRSGIMVIDSIRIFE